MADKKVYYSRNGQLVTEEQAKIIDAARHDMNLDDDSELDSDTESELDSDTENDSDDEGEESHGR